MFTRKFLCAAALAAIVPFAALAEDGVTAESVTFGQVAAFEGPAAALGTGMREGILAAFNEVNRPPRALCEPFFDLHRFTVMERGGHFPAMEVPADLVEEVRALLVVGLDAAHVVRACDAQRVRQRLQLLLELARNGLELGRATAAAAPAATATTTTTTAAATATATATAASSTATATATASGTAR